LPRAVAVALLAGFLLVLHAAALRPLAQRRGHLDQAAAQAALLNARREVLVVGRTALERARLKWRERLAGEPLHLAGDSPAFAGAALQARVRASLQARGGLIVSLQVLPVAADAASGELLLRAQVRLRYEAMYALLRELEEGLPPLIVERLSVRSVPPGPPAEAVEASFDLIAFARAR
jgi:hypothetical protein